MELQTAQNNAKVAISKTSRELAAAKASLETANNLLKPRLAKQVASLEEKLKGHEQELAQAVQEMEALTNG